MRWSGKGFIPFSCSNIFYDDFIKEPASVDSLAAVIVPDPQEVQVSEGPVKRHDEVTNCTSLKLLVKQCEHFITFSLSLTTTKITLTELSFKTLQARIHQFSRFSSLG